LLWRTVIGGGTKSEEIGDIDRGDHADDRHNDEQLDQREALLIFVHHVFHLLLEKISWFCFLLRATGSERIPSCRLGYQRRRHKSCWRYYRQQLLLAEHRSHQCKTHAFR